MLIRLARCLAFAAATVGAAAAQAATIATSQDSSGALVITVSGELFRGDEKRFADLAIGVEQATVVLAGPGGNLFTGLEIGKAIRLKGFATLVENGTECASACGLIWLAGTPRYLGPEAQVGFHAAYAEDNGELISSSGANAAVGVYLGQLGLPVAAIVAVTEERPDSMRWFDLAEAARIGIEARRYAADGTRAVGTGPAGTDGAATAYISEESGSGGQPTTAYAVAHWRYLDAAADTPTVEVAIEVPSRAMTVRLVMGTSHAAKDASYLFEISVEPTADKTQKSVQKIAALGLKKRESADAEALQGALLKAAEGRFQLALAEQGEAVARNLALLREGQWFDLSMIYADGQRATLTFYKGSAGREAIENALIAWDGGTTAPVAVTGSTTSRHRAGRERR